MSAKPKAAAAKKTAVAVAKKVAAVKSLSGLVQPLGDRLLILVEGAAERTPGGLYIPTTSTMDRPTQGRVVAKGAGGRNKKGQLRPLDVEVGDSVFFQDYAGTTIQFDGVDYLMIHEQQVLGIAE